MLSAHGAVWLGHSDLASLYMLTQNDNLSRNKFVSQYARRRGPMYCTHCVINEVYGVPGESTKHYMTIKHAPSLISYTMYVTTGASSRVLCLSN